MNQFSGESVAYWNESPELPHHPPLEASPTVDVCIVGAGIAGLTAAYLLGREGKSVIVLEQAKIASGDTGRTTAHLSPIMDDGLAEIEKWHGLEGAKLAYRSHSDAIDLIEKIVADEKIDCDFKRVDAYLFEGQKNKDRDLEEEFKASQRIGVRVARVDRVPLKDFDTGAALKFPDQAQFHVTKYLKRLAHVVSKLGVKVHDDTRVSNIEFGDGKPAKVSVTKSRHHVNAHFVIEAANSLVTGSVRTITKLYPYRTFAIGALVAKGSVPVALYWDTEDPYHYVRTQAYDAKHDLLIIGGEDHKTGQENDANIRYSNLEGWARKRWPQIEDVKYKWSGQVLETTDGLALIGQNPGNPENSLVVTGDSGHGMTHGTLGGMILTDTVLGRTHAYAKLYSPSRLHPSSVATWAEENANVGLQYLDWIKKDDIQSVDQLPPDEGSVFSHGLTKVAVYKDKKGVTHSCSAVCTHLGGIVSWNSEEKTWDCPCHGSRFDRYGKVIATPAIESLGPAKS